MTETETLFATSVLSAAMHGALAEMEEYFNDSYYTKGVTHSDKNENNTN